MLLVVVLIFQDPRVQIKTNDFFQILTVLDIFWFFLIFGTFQIRNSTQPFFSTEWNSICLLVQDFQSVILHEHLIKILELLERVLVMLTSTLGEDIHPEVCLSDFLLVVVLVAATESLSTSLKFLLNDNHS